MHSNPPLTLAASSEQAPGRDTALREALSLLRPFFDDASVTEICINRPGEVWAEGAKGWRAHLVEGASLTWCKRVATLIATYSSQRINEQQPILSGDLPEGERVQVVIPPAVEPGTVSITIRKPAIIIKSPDEYEASGFHDEVLHYPLPSPELFALLDPVEQELLKLRAERKFWDFYKLAIREHKNIVISGATGSGKTTFGRALLQFIPEWERLLTIEDVREMFLPDHPNRVHLLYSEGGQGTAEVSGKTLLQACLRMKPDRVLLAELRSKVAYDYIVNISSGHPGSITTVHAGSAAGAFEMLMLRVKESPEGQTLSREDIRGLLRSQVDIVLQVHVFSRTDTDGKPYKVRRLTEVFYDPAFKRKQLG